MPKFSYQLIIQKNVLQNAETLFKLGYDAVELMISKPDKTTEEIFKKILKTGLMISAIGTGLAARKGLTLNSHNMSRRFAAEKFLLKTIGIANKFDSDIIIASVMGNCKIEDFSIVEKGLTKIAKINANYRSHTRLLLEPRNRYETQLFRNTVEVEQLIESLQSEKIGLLLDTFHSNIEEKSITDTIQKSKYLSQLHFADSNRKAIGLGHIDFKGIFEVLKKIKFDQVISMEYETSEFEPDAKRSLQKIKNGLIGNPNYCKASLNKRLGAI